VKSLQGLAQKRGHGVLGAAEPAAAMSSSAAGQMAMMGMMDEGDPRVKSLQDLAWGLQSMGNKPGCKIPEACKKESYKLASKAISLCSNAGYLEEADFLERSKAFTKKIEAKKIELQEIEEVEKQKLTGKCYRAAGGGNYEVSSLAGPGGALSNGGDIDPNAPLPTTAGEMSAQSLTVSEIIARCNDDPEALWLSNVGLKDSGLDAVCDGLRRGGSKLTSIDLSHNHIADAGIQRLVTALASGACPHLQELWLGGNEFGALGSQILKAGLGALRKNLSVHIEESASDSGVTAEAAPAERSYSSRGAETAVDGDPGVTPPGDECRVGDGEGATAPSAPLVAPVAPIAAAEKAQAAPSASEATPSLEPVKIEQGPPGEGGGWVRAAVPLPEGVLSAQDLELDISERRLVVKSLGGALVADAALPSCIDPASAQAAFSRKRRMLTVTMYPRESAL